MARYPPTINLDKALQLADHLENKDEYVFYEETAYLMASPKNAERLNQAINEVALGKTTQHKLIKE